MGGDILRKLCRAWERQDLPDDRNIDQTRIYKCKNTRLHEITVFYSFVVDAGIHVEHTVPHNRVVQCKFVQVAGVIYKMLIIHSMQSIYIINRIIQIDVLGNQVAVLLIL